MHAVPEPRCKQFAENKKKNPLGGFVPLLLPRAAATFPFLGGFCLGIFGSCARINCSTWQGEWHMAHARGASQGDRCPKRGLSPHHSSPKPCQKPHPCQHRHKQPELGCFCFKPKQFPCPVLQAACSRQRVKSSALPARSSPLSTRRENEEFNRVSSYCLPLDFRLRAGDVSGCFCEAGAEEW